MYFIEDCGNNVNIYRGVFVQDSECSRFSVRSDYVSAFKQAISWAKENKLKFISDTSTGKKIRVLDLYEL